MTFAMMLNCCNKSTFDEITLEPRTLLSVEEESGVYWHAHTTIIIFITNSIHDLLHDIADRCPPSLASTETLRQLQSMDDSTLIII